MNLWAYTLLLFLILCMLVQQTDTKQTSKPGKSKKAQPAKK